MKLKSILTLAATAILGLVTASSLTAADKHDHDHDHDHAAKAGPTGGKLLTEVEPHAEFLVTKDKKVEIRFVGEDNKVIAPGTQVVTVTIGRSKPTKLSFTKEGDKLISDKAVPEGNDHPTVVEVKADAKARPVRSRFNLNLTQCPTCVHAEYACTCDHGDHGDDAKKDEGKKDEGKKDEGKKGKK